MGDVTVTILEMQGNPIPEFERSNNMHGDFLRGEVTWPGERTLTELVGRRVQLRIRGRWEKVYSYWFE
jgi:hypothetical protein